MNFDQVVAKRCVPPFRPPKDHLNCDPSLELEEMIIEAKPLHKKKKRLAKQRSIQRETDVEPSFIKEFIVYNRFKEVHRREMEKKEQAWERELAEAMARSEVPNLKVVQTVPGCGPDAIEEATACSADGVEGRGTVIDYIDRTPSPKPSCK